MLPDTANPSKPAIYVSALICESTISGDDGVISAIRIADIFKAAVIEVAARCPHGSSQIIYVRPPIKVAALLMFRSEAPVEFEMQFHGRTSAGDLLEADNRALIKMDGGVRGFTLKVELLIDQRNSGDIWFEIFIDGALATKLPFRIDQQEPDNSQSSTQEPSAKAHDVPPGE